MNMSNEEKDKFIKENLSKDTYIFSGKNILKSQISRDIEVSKIRLKKYTFGQRKFTRFLMFVLVVSLGFNLYFAQTSDYNLLFAKDNSAQELNLKTAEEVENIIDQESTENEELIENIIGENVINENIISENLTVSADTQKENNIESSTIKLDINEELLKKQLANYALSIGRLEGRADTLEENTVLLLISAKSFSEQDKSTDVDNISVKYALTAENVHLFLKESIGVNIESVLSSYTNYIGYTEFSKAYVYGKDANILGNEKYEVTKLNVNSQGTNQFAISGEIKKVVEEEKSIYEFEATIVINEDYTYTPYKIKSFKANLKTGSRDNVVRLVDYVEEVVKKKK